MNAAKTPLWKEKSCFDWPSTLRFRWLGVSKIIRKQEQGLTITAFE